MTICNFCLFTFYCLITWSCSLSQKDSALLPSTKAKIRKAANCRLYCHSQHCQSALGQYLAYFQESSSFFPLVTVCTQLEAGHVHWVLTPKGVSGVMCIPHCTGGKRVSGKGNWLARGCVAIWNKCSATMKFTLLSFQLLFGTLRWTPLNIMWHNNFYFL